MSDEREEYRDLVEALELVKHARACVHENSKNTLDWLQARESLDAAISDDLNPALYTAVITLLDTGDIENDREFERFAAFVVKMLQRNKLVRET